MNKNVDPKTIENSPFSWGVTSFFITPLTVLFCVLMAFMLLLSWPFIPFLCYFQRKQEIESLHASVEMEEH
jgi:hypothetical protein